jgi:hypothetical protein
MSHIFPCKRDRRGKRRHTNAAAANPDKPSATAVSLGIFSKFGTVSKNGTKNANNNTEIGAWFNNNCGLDTLKSRIFFPIQT